MAISEIKNLQVGPGIIAVRSAGGNQPSTPTPWEFEGLQSCSFDIDQKIVTAMGQFKMAFDSATVDMSIKGTLETVVLNGNIFANAISGDGGTLAGNLNSYRETYTLASVAVAAHTTSTVVTVGTVFSDGTNIQVYTTAGTTAGTAPTWATTVGSPTTDGTAVATLVCADTGAPSHVCVVTVAQSATYAQDGNVMYATTNVQFQDLGASQGGTPPGPPAVGQYVHAGTSGIYLFNSTDAASQVFISYQYTASTGQYTFPINNHFIGYGPYCEVNMQFPYQSSGSSSGFSVSAVNVALHLLAVRFGSMKTKTKRDGYWTVTYDFEAFCPPNGVAGQFYLPN